MEATSWSDIDIDVTVWDEGSPQEQHVVLYNEHILYNAHVFYNGYDPATLGPESTSWTDAS